LLPWLLRLSLLLLLAVVLSLSLPLRLLSLLSLRLLSLLSLLSLLVLRRHPERSEGSPHLHLLLLLLLQLQLQLQLQLLLLLLLHVLCCAVQLQLQLQLLLLLLLHLQLSLLVLRRHPRAKRRIPAFAVVVARFISSPRRQTSTHSPHPKNKPKTPVPLINQEKVSTQNHVCHAIHHKPTTKTPRPTTRFPQNPVVVT
jgi:hypothetical protein